MWNNLQQHLQGGPQATGAPPPPQGAPPPPQGAPPPPQGAPPPPQGAPPAPQGGQPQQGHGDLKAEVAQVLVQRAKTLTPEESQTFFNGITVPALQVLKKMLPEIGPAIDSAIAKKQGGGAPGAAAPGAAAPQGGAPMPPPQGAPVKPPSSGLRAI